MLNGTGENEVVLVKDLIEYLSSINPNAEVRIINNTNDETYEPLAKEHIETSSRVVYFGKKERKCQKN